MPSHTPNSQNSERGDAPEKIALLFAQAFALHQNGKLAEATVLYEQVLEARPGYFDAIQLLGLIAAQMENFPRAVELLTDALQIRPGHAVAHNNRGAALKELGQMNAAIADYDQAIALKPDYADAWYNRGIALKDVQQLEAAIASFDRAIAIRGGHAETYNNRGVALKELRRLDAAIADYDHAITIRADFAEAHNNRGVALQELLRLDAAVASFDHAIKLKPGYAEAWYNRGNALKELGQPATAIVSYAQAISLRPDYVDAHWNLSICQLLLGNYAQGWPEYEWRWKENINKPEDHRNFVQPRWPGKEVLAGKTILLYSEQGFGDTLQFCRYARMVANLGARVILEVQRPLAGLLNRLEGVSQIVARGDVLPPFDYQCPLMSLPLAFSTDSQSIPSFTRYIHSDPQKVAQWQARLGSRTRPRVGIAWSGNVAHKNDRSRSMTLADLAPLWSVDCEFFSLQKEIRESDRDTLQHYPGLRHFGDELGDFTDTAALCELMDVVICVDTSVAHLAGALGKPVWIMLPFSPDWRWLLERNDSPWYPGATLYRQEVIGDWAGVIARVIARIVKDLANMATMNDESTDISRLFPQAFALHQQGKYSEAAALYEQILAMQPTHFEATQLLGVLAAQTNDYPRAVVFLTDALKIKPNHAATYNNRGIAFKELKQLDAAIADYSQAITLNPDYTDAWYNRGIAFKELGQLDAAVADYHQAIACRPSFAEAHNNLGVALQALRQLDAAVASYDQATNIKPDFAEAFNNRGNALIELRQPDAAIASYGRAIAIKPDYARAWHNRGNAMKELGELDKAIADYDRAIDIAPDYAEAWHHRGNALMKRGQPDAAISSYDRAIAIAADYAEAYINRGAAWQALRKLDAAIADYGRAIACRENFAEAHNNIGVALQALRQLEAAIASYDRAIAIRPDYAEACNNRGNTWMELGQPSAAIASYDQAIAIKPDYAEAWYNHGNALVKLEQPDAAINSYARAITIRPDYAEAFNNRGNELQKCGYAEQAIADYDHAIAIQPGYADAYINRGNALKDAGEPHAAITDYDRAIAIDPDNAEAWFNRGNALKELRQLDAAVASHDRAVTLRPDHVEAHVNRGAVLQELLQLDAAEDSYRRAIAIQPDFAAAHWNIGFIDLLRGNFARGWSGYEWRWKKDGQDDDARRDFPQPRWLGDASLTGKTILLYWEQGLGDTLQFCRYARMVADLGARVILEVQRPLANLLAGLEGVSQLVASGDELPPFDYQCPLLSLPLAFKTDLQSIPTSARYIGSDPDRVSRWQAKLGAKTRPRVGIAWSGSVGHTNDRNRSMALADLAPLLAKDYDFFSLQKEIRDSDREVLQRLSHLRHFGDELADFSDTAALCGLMDIVISVDTSVAHLAGALGKPVWIMLPFSPDWRWLLERTDSPWYPSARLYRQERIGDWTSVIERVGKDLASNALDLPQVFAQAFALHQQGKLTEASGLYEQVIAVQPGHFDALQLQGVLAAQTNDYPRAVALLTEALKIRPNHAATYNNRGAALKDLGQLDAAIADYDRAIALKPDYADAWYNRGIAFKELGQPDAAVADYRHAIDIQPNHVDAHWNLSICQLLLGNYAQGWPEYEWRWKENINKPEDHRNFVQPRWLGKEALAGKTILLYSEQGFGDTLQFCRYARMVADLGAHVILEVQRPLAALLNGLEGVSQIVARGDALPPFDYQCPLMSLPLAFSSDSQSIPSFARYIQSDPQKVAQWRTRLGAQTRPRVGIAWAGSAVHKEDRNRSIALTSLMPLLTADCEFVSLQKEICTSDREALQHYPHLRHFGDEPGDFTDTAALCELMDVVISVDTSVAHLAGALGKPVWILLPFSPDWRWLLERTDSPWYPGAKLYRQEKIGDWTAVISRVNLDLTNIAPMNDTRVNIPTLFARAFALHQQGKLSEAATLYEKIITVQPAHFDALQLLGVIAAQTRDYPSAIDRLTDALKIRPDHAATYNNRGIAFKELRQLDAAIADYSQALALKPDYADAWYNRGIARKELDQLDAAVADYHHAIECKPDFAEAHNNLGVALQALRQFDAAVASYERAIAIRPDYAEAHNNRGNVLRELGQPGQPGLLDTAVASFDRAVAIRPDYAEAWYNRGNALMDQKQPDAAIDSHDRAIAIRPDYADAFNNRGNALRELGQLDAAVASYDRAIAIKPDHAEAFNNRGNALKDRGEQDKAIADYERAIAINPDYAEAYNNRGAAWQDLLQLDAAEDSCARAIAIKPDFAAAHWNLGCCRLLRGDFARGFPGYEWRWKMDEQSIAADRHFPQPLWLGDAPLAGKTILLHAEQGLGDTLQFCRYAKLVASRGARVILEVQQPLRQLLRNLEGVSQLIVKDEVLPPFDYQCPLMSLPLAFGTDLQSIPAPASDIRSDAEQKARWQVRLGNPTRPRIGIAWSGNAGHKNDRNRSIALAGLAPLLALDGEFFSLQKEVRECDREALLKHPNLRHFGDELTDFTDTAALCELMDIVISADTSVAHLAGTLGRPVWIMLPFRPDWRWMIERTDSPWYPAARLYRQKRIGDWAGVIEHVRVDLASTFSQEMNS